ncbi:MAG TPA: CoA transferase [Rubrobacteraceae bacterium]|nr:CoA transferase [Rubrobacteraceae bacterium]
MTVQPQNGTEPRQFQPLAGTRLVSLAVNLPGPVAAARLRDLGAEVTKVEPPAGDLLARVAPGYYDELSSGLRITILDLKQPEDRARLDGLLERADLLLTSSRPASLERLGLGREKLTARFPRLSHVAIVGHPAPDDRVPGHDLTYQAGLGLLTPPDLPRTLLADLAGAERAVSAALALLLSRERGGGAGYAEVSLAGSAAGFAEPLRHGLTAPGGSLGGGLPEYNLYRTSDAWISVAALEPHFRRRLLEGLGLDENARYDDLARVFATRAAGEWERWAENRDLPLAALREAPNTVQRQEAQ